MSRETDRKQALCDSLQKQLNTLCQEVQDDSVAMRAQCKAEVAATTRMIEDVDGNAGRQ